ncbi:MAG: zf-HC2 domain-containing protein [Candidatus Wallbacteria bacterium]|nr:zf-HC2 domain-containing protein [Candidatus Wallbacteria bacterium]
MSTRNECGFYRTQLSAYVDEELGRSERASLEAHLASCPGCGAELEGLRGLVREVREMPRCETGPQYLIELRRRIEGGDQPQSQPWLAALPWFRVNLAVGAVMTGVIGVAVFQSGAIRQAARQPEVVPVVISDAALDAATVKQDAPAFAAPQALPARTAAPVIVEAKRPVAAETSARVEAGKAEVSGALSRSEAVAEKPAARARASANTMAAAAPAPAPPGSLSGLESEKKRQPSAERPSVRAGPAAPVDTKRDKLLEPVGGSVVANKLPSEKEKDLGSEFMSEEVAAGLPKTGLSVGRLSDASPSGVTPLARPGQVVLGSTPPVPKDAEGGLATADEVDDGVEVTARSPAPTPGPAKPEPEVVPEGGSVTHEVLLQYLEKRVLSSPEGAVRSRPEGTILLKVTRFHAFLRELRTKADELSVADVIETSSGSFEMSVLGRGGKDGLEALANRLAGLPGAQLSGLMFEKVSEKGEFACRVMVTVED